MGVRKTLKKISPLKLPSLLRRQNDPTLAFQLFQNPNPTMSTTKSFPYTPLSYDLIISKLGRAKMFPEMEQILTQMNQETRFTPTENIYSNVITFYGNSRLPEYALDTFNQIRRGTRTIKSFNAILQALLKCKEHEKIRKLFESMDEYGIIPDDVTYSVVINACCTCGSLNDAWCMFDEMLRRGICFSEVTFATLINALCVDGQLDEAFRLKENMMASYNLKPNVVAYASLIKGFCMENRLDSALKLKNEMMIVVDGVGVNTDVYTALITALFRGGRKEEAIGLLEEMREKGCEPDTVTCNAMISGLCSAKDYEVAFRMLEEMVEKGCKPDVISYNVIIGGLCKAGKVKEAMDLFENMPKRDCAPGVATTDAGAA